MSYTVQHERKGRTPKPVSWWIVAPVLILAATALFLAAVFIGHRVGYAEKPATITLTSNTCPVPVQALTQWNCSESELREYRNVCLRRWKATKQ